MEEIARLCVRPVGYHGEDGDWSGLPPMDRSKWQEFFALAMDMDPVTKPYKQASGNYSLKVNKNADFMGLYVHREDKSMSCGSHPSEAAAYSALADVLWGKSDNVRAWCAAHSFKLIGEDGSGPAQQLACRCCFRADGCSEAIP